MGSIGNCCCDNCCLSSSQLPTSITLECDGIDYLLTMGAWVSTANCCWRAESTAISVPGLTTINDMIELQKYESKNYHINKVYTDDILAGTVVPNCFTGPATKDKVEWYTRTSKSEYVHEYFLAYNVPDMTVQVILQRSEATCDPDVDPVCSWIITAIFTGRTQTGANRNRADVVGRLIGSTTLTVTDINPDIVGCRTVPTPSTQNWSAINYDDTSKPQTFSPLVQFSRGVSLVSETPPAEVELEPGADYSCVPSCAGIVMDEETYGTPTPGADQYGWINQFGFFQGGSPPSDVLVDPGPSGVIPQTNRRIILNGDGSYSNCNGTTDTYLGFYNPANKCFVGGAQRFPTLTEGSDARTSERLNALTNFGPGGSPNVVISRPSCKLKFTWPS